MLRSVTPSSPTVGREKPSKHPRYGGIPEHAAIRRSEGYSLLCDELFERKQNVGEKEEKIEKEKGQKSHIHSESQSAASGGRTTQRLAPHVFRQYLWIVPELAPRFQGPLEYACHRVDSCV